MSKNLRKHTPWKHAALAALLLSIAPLLISSKACAQQAPSASAPRTLSYQGILINTGNIGTFATGSRLLTVTLYSDANGNNKLWQSTMNTTVDSNGVFNCTLGTAENPLPAPSAMDRPIWLGVTVDNGPELRPLSEMTATAYALNVVDNAITTAKLADSSVTTAKLANGSVTWNKMGTEYVPYIRVNGAKVTTGQNSINFTGGDGLKVDYDSNSMSVIIHPDSGLATTNTGGGMKPMFVGGNPTATNSDNGVFGSGNHAGSTNTVGGGTSNTAFGGSSPDLNGHATVGGGESNTAKDTFATIAGGDTNTAAGYESTIGGGTFNTVTNRDGFIGGGLHNTNKSRYSAMAGGDANFIDDSTDASFMGGGLANRIGFYGNYQIIGDTTYIGANVLSGGRNNYVKSVTAALVGGLNNTIDTDANEAFIGAGSNNKITQNGFIQGQTAAIVAGSGNTAFGNGDFIGAGAGGSVTLQDAGIVAGSGNFDSAATSVIGGGVGNTINGRNFWTGSGGASFIGAGTDNTVSNEGSLVGAGYDDTVISSGSAVVTGHNSKIESSANYSFIGAGETNIIDTGSADAAIVSGSTNMIDTNSPSSIIGGGDSNSVASAVSTIGGGAQNLIQTNLPYSTIGGGLQNNILADDGGGDETTSFHVIAGGHSNTIENMDFDGAATISGGDSNTIDGPMGVIAGGKKNLITQGAGDNPFVDAGQQTVEWDVIGGGLANTITLAASASVHSINQATIGGGNGNIIEGDGNVATIPGGDTLKAQSYAQTVVGYHNIAAGAVSRGTPHDFATSGSQVDAPLFIVGNGDGTGAAVPQSDASTFSYDGHLTVFDVNGNSAGGGRPEIYGATYQDNTIVAWADVGTSPAPGPIVTFAPLSDVGVAYIKHPHLGVYVVGLSIQKPDGSGISQILTKGSITVTIRDSTDVNDTLGTNCGYATASEIGKNGVLPTEFIVRTYTGMVDGCALQDKSFFLKVCGRP